jgi:hypothetical protein
MGRKVDNSDMQYSQFRNHLPTLVLLACGYLVASHIYRRSTQEWHPMRQIYFYFAASALVVTTLHGTSIIKILVIITTSFMIGQLTGGSAWNPFLTWTFNLLVLFSNEYYKGYKFESIGLAALVSEYINLTVAQTERLFPLLGSVQWHYASMAHLFHLWYATSGFFQYGLLLAF